MEINDNLNESSQDVNRKVEGNIPVEPHDLLEELLAQITPENLHSEFDFGLPQGREIEDGGTKSRPLTSG